MAIKTYKDFISESAGGIYTMTGAYVIFNNMQKSFGEIHYEGDSIIDVVGKFVEDNLPGYQLNPDDLSFVTFSCDEFNVRYIDLTVKGEFNTYGNFSLPYNIEDAIDYNYWFSIKKNDMPITEQDIRRENIRMRK